jgi:hypothetical protein
MAALFRVAYLYSITKRQRWFFKLWAIYFTVLFAAHVVYLFAESKVEMIKYGGEIKECVSIELYRRMNATDGFFGVGTIAIMIVLIINIVLMIIEEFKSHGTKN